MSGHKVGGMKNLRIDRVFRGVGRIALSSGTNNKNVYNGILAMLNDLQERGRLDDLKAIQSKHLTPLQAYTKWKDGKLVGVASISYVTGLRDSLNDWVDTYQCADTTRAGYVNNINQLLKQSKAKQLVSDLPTVLRKYKDHCKKNDTPKSFNHTRATCLAYARDRFGKHSDLYRDISSIDVLDYRKARMNNPLTVKDVVTLTKGLKSSVADMVWTMCTTGMGFKEYGDGFTVETDHIIIHGKKNNHRWDRMVPLIRTPTRRVLQYKRFREVIQEVRPDVTPYDFRRTYAVWLESAGVLRSHIEMYMGHSPRRMTDLYLIRDVSRYLNNDADLVRQFIEKQKTS